jgi:signal transduction histidine kinase
MRSVEGSGRRSRRDRISLILLSIAAIALFTVLVPIHAVLYGTPLPVALILGAALCGAPLLAIVRPRLSIGLACVAAFLLPLVVSAEGVWPWPWSVPALIAFAGFIAVITFLHGWRMGLIPLLIGSTGSLVVPLLRPGTAAANPPTADLIVAASISAVAYLLAVAFASRTRARQELTEVRELSVQEQSRRILMEERARIARELHDVVAHSLSLIQVQASTARYRVPDLADDAATEFDDIAATARGSLTEMRRLLGVLRTDDQTAQLVPQQGIEDIPALVESIRRIGVDVTLELVEVTPAVPTRAVPTSVQIAAFRIVQEALSNAVRHAPGAPISVSVRTEPGILRLHVRNGAIASPMVKGAGHGLQGMRERVALLDGSLEAGSDSDGGWTVAALLRWEYEPSASSIEEEKP